MGIISDMARAADEMLTHESMGGMGVGDVRIKRIVLGDLIDPNNPWGGRVETTKEWKLKAYSRRKNQKFDSGTMIETVGDIITCAVFETEPRLTDILVIDGKDKAIADIKSIPSAGAVAAWQLFVEV